MPDDIKRNLRFWIILALLTLGTFFIGVVSMMNAAKAQQIVCIPNFTEKMWTQQTGETRRAVASMSTAIIRFMVDPATRKWTALMSTDRTCILGAGENWEDSDFKWGQGT
jgi:hypothetical protein